MIRHVRKTKSLAAAALLATTAVATPAWACGGFFCSTSPVDQQAERIIFRQTSPETVESIVEIQYQGDPQAFAWIVPVPGVPRDMATFSPTAFQLLDLATGPNFLLPNDCVVPGSVRGTDDTFGGPPESSGDGNDGVEVLDHQIVGDYDVTTVSATDGRRLVEWLRTHEYRVVDGMVPFIDLYLGQGLNFVAAKLVSGADTSGIKPLKMVYDSPTPMVPLRMTSIAAVPEMGVKVFLLGDTRYTSKSVPELTVDPAKIVFDVNTNTSNWPAAVARTLDAAQGEGLVVDSAARVDDVRFQVENAFTGPIGGEDPEIGRQAMLGLLDGTRYVTRMYGRFSAEEMGLDLTFEAAPDLPDVDRNRQLTLAQVPMCSDGSTPTPPVSNDPCDFVACGQGGTCLLTPDVNGILVPGCACVDGAVARTLTDSAAPTGVAVSCVDVRMNVDPIIDVLPGIDDNDGTVDPTPPPLPDPCVGNPCGDFGECFAFNAQQTCLCERGYVAVAERAPDGKTVAVCRQPEGTVPDDFYRRRLPEPRLPYPGKATARGTLSDDGCSTTGTSSAFPLFALLLGAPLVGRRRRRA